jgi:hypothetical protein
MMIYCNKMVSGLFDGASHYGGIHNAWNFADELSG